VVDDVRRRLREAEREQATLDHLLEAVDGERSGAG
jgi:hypothetical protein